MQESIKLQAHLSSSWTGRVQDFGVHGKMYYHGNKMFALWEKNQVCWKTINIWGGNWYQGVQQNLTHVHSGLNWSHWVDAKMLTVWVELNVCKAYSTVVQSAWTQTGKGRRISQETAKTQSSSSSHINAGNQPKVYKRGVVCISQQPDALESSPCSSP